MKRILAVFTVILCIFQGLTAETSFYVGADASTQKTLGQVNTLILQEKYKSAFDLISKETGNVYLVAKKVEIATNFFVQSLNHKMFAFKNLAKGETLDALRQGSGSFSMYLFDPVEEIFSLIDSGKTDPILYKALGDYYYDVSRRYQGVWIEDDEIIANKIAENYNKVYKAGLYTIEMLTHYAGTVTGLGDYYKAIELYTKALSEDSSLFSAHFNLAYCYLQTQQFDKALVEGDKAIVAYADYPNYQMDAFLLSADAAFYKTEFNRAISYLESALEISEEEYRIFLRLGKIYLAMGNIQKANENLDILFAFAPTYPSAGEMVSQAFLAVNNTKDLYKFYARNLQKFSGELEAEGNLLFYLTLLYENDGNTKEALETILLAKKKYIQSGNYEGQTQEAIETLIARNTL